MGDGVMQTIADSKQLELSLWQDLKTAKSEPVAANQEQLWHKLEQVIEHTDKNHLLRVAGDAIALIVEIYVMRANAILSTLETKDSNSEPILSFDFLNDLMRQSMTIDLSDMMEDVFTHGKEPRAHNRAAGSIVAPLNKEAAKTIAHQTAKSDPKQMLVELAGNEQVSQWSDALALWMQQEADGKAVSCCNIATSFGDAID